MLPRNIKGLSLSRPWPWAFLNGPIPKRIENRSWKAPKWADWIALHSAKSWDENGVLYIKRYSADVPSEKILHPAGEIFAICRLDYCHSIEKLLLSPDHLGQERWSFGPYCWAVKDFVPLKTPVRCSGSQGLWAVGEEVFSALQASYAEALGGPAVSVSPSEPLNNQQLSLLEGLK